MGPRELDGVVPRGRWSLVWSRVSVHAREVVIIQHQSGLLPIWIDALRRIRAVDLGESVEAVHISLSTAEWRGSGIDPDRLNQWTPRRSERGVIVRPPTDAEVAWLALKGEA